MLLIACEEKDLSIEPQTPKYDLSDSETDILQHYKHEFYKKYNVIIIDDVDTSDFRYTISSSKLELDMIKSTLSDTEKISLFQILENTFYAKYAQNFIKERAPLRLIIADTIYALKTDYKGNPIREKCSYYITNSLFAVSTNAADLIVKDGIAYGIDKYGSEKNLGEQLFSKIVIENILMAHYGEKWGQLFLSAFGIIRPYLMWSDWQEAYDTFFKINFNDSRYDPNDPDNPLNRPFSEYPGVHDAFPMPANQNYEAIEAYFNKLGFPNIRYRAGNPMYYAESINWEGNLEPAFARISISIEDLIPLWVEWDGKYTEIEKEEKFLLYPELKKNYLAMKELLQKYAGIEI